MAVISINGLPGKGKTLTSVNLAIKHFKSENKEKLNLEKTSKCCICSKVKNKYILTITTFLLFI